MASVVRQSGDRERVRDASDIVRIVGEVIALRPHGREYVGLCPFHDDHKPSMTVVPAKQIFHCFVCGTGGDVFAFVQKYHKMDFREALEHLAERAGITLTPRHAGGEETPAGASRGDLVRACQAAGEFFRAIYRHPEHGAAARDVVRRRGISDEMVEAFGIGAAPARWDGLLLTAQHKGLDLELFVEAGLLKRRDSGGLYDVFRNRLMFPIRDQIGRPIAFGGRKIAEEDEPKYLNSPETRLFRKAGTLFALDRAARDIQARRTAIITEGYTDAIACHQAGLTNVVATLGTALTAEHAAVLRRMCDTVVLLFDGDAAGQRAADRAVEVFFAERIDVKIAVLSGVTDAKDPDELLKRPGVDGRALLERAVASARDLLEYRFDRMRAGLRGAGLSAVQQATMAELARLAELGLSRVEPMRRQLIVRRLTEITGLSDRVIAGAIPAGKARPERAESAPRRPLAVGEHLIGCILCEGRLWSALEDPHRALDMASLEGPARNLADAMIRVADSGMEPDLKTVLGTVESAEVQALAVSLAARTDAETDRDPKRLGEHFRECLRTAALGRIGVEQAVAASPEERLERLRARATALGDDRRVLGRGGA